MISLPRLTLRLRFSASIIAVVLLFTLTNITYQLSSENTNLRLDNLQNEARSQRAIVTIRQELEVQQKQILVLDALIENEGEKLSEDEIGNGIASLMSLKIDISRLEPFVFDQTIKSYNTLINTYNLLHEIWQQYYVGYNDGRTPSIKKIESIYIKTMSTLNDFETKEIFATNQQADSLQKIVRFTDRIALAIYIFTIVLTVTLGYLLIRYTNRSLNELNKGTVRIGGGDLKYHIPVNNDDEIGDLTIAFNEMSEKLSNAMAQVQQSKENADQANRSKTNFLANMSHELRTPLNAIIGYSEMIIEDYREESKLDEKQAIEDLQRILSSGRHLLQLINDVLDLSKIESGNMTVFNESFDSVEIIEELLTTMSPIAKKSGNELILEKSKNIPKLYNDAVKFRQLFLNLLSNACKFTEKGKVTVLISFNKKTKNIVFHVSDTGIGMSPSQIDKIFKAFVQADSSTSKKYGGTGLGLSISKQFVELMQGKLDVTSAEGKGTTFTVILPLEPIQKGQKEIIPKENQQELTLSSLDEINPIGPKISRTILLFIKNSRIRERIIDQLKIKEVSIHIINNEIELIEFSKKHKPDLILMDSLTTRNSYYETISIIKREAETSRIPIIFLNNFSNSNVNKYNYFQIICESINNDRIASLIRKLNPQDRKGNAFLLGPKNTMNNSFMGELSDEAWNCSIFEDEGKLIDKISEQTPDIIFVSIGADKNKVKKMLRSFEKKGICKFNEKLNISPIFLVDCFPLLNKENRQLDKPADQIILHDRY